jgi:hypothetical protein
VALGRVLDILPSSLTVYGIEVGAMDIPLMQELDLLLAEIVSKLETASATDVNNAVLNVGQN